MSTPASLVCPSENEVLAVVRGTLPSAMQRGVQEHIDACAACQELVACVIDAGAAEPDAGARPPKPEVALAPGRCLGRYRVREVIGAGALGIVYLADDPQLGRAVAVKVLRVQDEHASARLLREARALARVAHPNVIVVHEVGTFEDQVFMAMEFVDGAPLTVWLAEQARSTPEILDAFAQAGRGLAVAHAAGLVHRDFKPDNVLVGRDGRVRVVDFGLAREGVAQPTGAALPAAGEASPALLTLTRTGALVGTPAYMAPEQYEGHPVDAQTDQFSFAVALFEALYGRRPFEADSIVALAVAVSRGEVRIPRTARRVPPHVTRALLRALAVAPEERFPSMTALLEAIERPRTRPRALVMVAATLALGAVAVLFASATRREDLSSPEPGAATAPPIARIEPSEPPEPSEPRPTAPSGSAASAPHGSRSAVRPSPSSRPTSTRPAFRDVGTRVDDLFDTPR